MQVTHGQAGAIAVSVPTAAGLAAPSGSVTYTITGTNGVAVSSGTVALTAGSGASSASVPVASTLASGSFTVALSYAGDTNYGASTLSVAVVVAQLKPTVSFTPPSNIVYGASLGSALSGSASYNSVAIPGVFSYTAGLTGGSAATITGATVLAAGPYTLTASFVPTDMTTYANATAQATLTVAKAAPSIALGSSNAVALVQDAITFSATVSFTPGPVSGNVSFFDGTSSTALGTSALAIRCGDLLNVFTGGRDSLDHRGVCGRC